MKKYAIFGNPINHSKSPAMQSSGFKFLGIKANYKPFLLKDGKKLKEVFLKNNFSGANITLPHKIEAFKQADILDRYAKKIGAVNTWVKKDDIIYGYNTDAPGFYEAIKEFKDIKSALLLGAGGTAKAIESILIEKTIKVDILNRSDKSDEFKSNFYTWDNFENKNYDLIINSTSAGLKDDFYPAPIDILKNIIKNSKFAIDCIYGIETPFLKLSKKYNKPSKDGTDMLLYQGIIALSYWVGDKSIINNQKLIDIMKKRL